MRLDEYLVKSYPNYSRSFLAKLNKNGRVTVNGEYRKSSFDVTDSDKIIVDFDSDSASYAPLEIPIAYEDENVVVINKPAGVLTHSKGAYNPEPTVATWLADHIHEAKNTDPEHSRDGIVHRLDRATSGVMILAKNSDALAFLQKQFSQRTTKKSYIALVEGSLKEEQARIEWPIGRNPKKPQTFRVHANGKSAITEYKVLHLAESKDFGTVTLVSLKPETGRTHQLRVHMQHLGHPIIGDTLYKGKEADRLYLHAVSLEVTLEGGKRMVFEAPLPKEFEKYR